MSKLKRVLSVLAIAITCGSSSVSAQIFVTIRPSRPVYVRTTAPSPRHIWIEEDWNERGDGYEWGGGHWAEPPRPGNRYHRGYWRHSSRGDQWTPGRWDDGHRTYKKSNHGNGNRGNGHGNGHQKANGHGNGHGNGHKGGGHKR
jgi:hypothetical protein